MSEVFRHFLLLVLIILKCSIWWGQTLRDFTQQILYLIDIVVTSQATSHTSDFNGDGKADILWRNDNGRAFLWNSTSGSSVGFIGQDLGLVGTDWHITQGQ